ncbi:MAG: zinc ribbon domain-containing protein [Thermodesulfobacteriota bacterium]
MPIYEYHCPRCQDQFEVLVMNSRDKITCPKCDCKKVERLMSGFAHKSAGGKMVSSGGCASCKSSSCASCH